MWTFAVILACNPAPTVMDGPTGWETALDAVDVHIAAAEPAARARPDDWVRAEEVALLWKARARLTGDYDDYAEAEEWLQAAFEHAPPGAGPFMSRARLHFTLHRLDAVEPDLEAAEQRLLLDDIDRSDVALLRADLAYQRGDYSGAAEGIAEAASLHEGMGTTLSEAQLRWHTGDPDAALDAFDVAAAQYHGTSAEPRAWLHLQRGLVALDRGRWVEAMDHYERADAEMSGWWLIDEHRAEILTLTGRTHEATLLYEDIVDRTGNAEFMDALAAIALDRGDDAQARTWIARAEAVYADQLARFPEAAAGHALQHYLDFGTDPAFALDLARRNATLRPNGEALTLLARAELAAGDAPAARATIERVLATPWWSATTHVVAAEIYDALGEHALAAEQREVALTIDPHALGDHASGRPSVRQRR